MKQLLSFAAAVCAVACAWSAPAARADEANWDGRPARVMAGVPEFVEVAPTRYGLAAGGTARATLVGGADEAGATSASGGDAGGAADLAKQLSNPVAALISVPFQFNLDNGYGKDDAGYRAYLNFQPVIPISISCDWNVISRTIVPFIHQHDIFPGAGDQDGVGDTTQSFFFSPKEPNRWGLIWGVGPVFLLPTASDELLGSERWGAGPTFVGLRQAHGWTYGILANHLWSFAGEEDRADVNSTYMQPFVTYTTKEAWTFSLNTESTYNWESEAWSVPINGLVTKLVKIGKLPVSLGMGARYWAQTPDGGPEGWGLRLVVTFLFPKK